jgi:hypothetical protein
VSGSEAASNAAGYAGAAASVLEHGWNKNAKLGTNGKTYTKFNGNQHVSVTSPTKSRAHFLRMELTRRRAIGCWVPMSSRLTARMAITLSPIFLRQDALVWIGRNPVRRESDFAWQLRVIANQRNFVFSAGVRRLARMTEHTDAVHAFGRSSVDFAVAGSRSCAGSSPARSCASRYSHVLKTT